MVNIPDLLAQAAACHRAGNLLDAEVLYRQVIEADPACAEALFQLGAVCLGLGKLDDAAASLTQAVRLMPEHVDAHHHLAVVHVQQGKLSEAIASLETAHRLKPESVEIGLNLQIVRTASENCRGIALAEQGKLDEANECHGRALEWSPNDAESHRGLAFVLAKQNKLDEAVAAYRRARELNPRDAELAYNIGVLLAKQRRLDEAAVSYRQALQLRPDHLNALVNLGFVLEEQNELDEAVACHRQLLQLKPDDPEAHDNLGYALMTQGKLDEAETCFRRAIALDAGFAQAYSNLAYVFLLRDELGESLAWYREALKLRADEYMAHYNVAYLLMRHNKLHEALRGFERALELKPDYADAHWNHAATLFLMGRFAEAWPEYEWRFRRPGEEEPTASRPRWAGAPLAGRTILLRSEQGLGDAMQFVRYAELVKGQGGRVIVECVASLARLLASCPGVDGVHVKGQPLPPFDVHIPLLSLPGIFGTSLDNIPVQVPYLFPDPELLAQWKEELGAEAASHPRLLKIGIAWQGNPAHPLDRIRSIPLKHFAGIAATRGVRLYSLQAGAGREQLTALADRSSIVDLSDRLGDFYNTAAIVRNLDLVITCDSAPAHLAGALGVPVWTALTFAPDWRWLLARADCPWYPTMRLFRQERFGDWEGVFGKIEQALATLV